MKKFIFILFAFCLFDFAQSMLFPINLLYSQWTQLPNLPVSGTVYDMYFVNANTGWVTLYSPFNTLKTTDGGQSWTVQLSGNTLRAGVIQFFNDTIGNSLGSNSSNQSTILKTTNGGVNWTAIYVSSGDRFADISFVNKDTGWVCGDNGMPLLRIWRTTDGGSSFQVQYAGAGGSFTKIFMLKEKVNGEYVGWCIIGQTLYKTINSGLNWIVINNSIGGGCQSLHDIYFIDSSKGIITRNLSCFSKTIDGGYTWSHYYEYGSVNSGIGVGDSNKLWLTLGAVDTLIKTLNFFETYGKQLSAAYANVIFALDTSIVYAGRNTVNMEKTTNGGGNIVGIELINNEIPDKFFLSQNYPNPFNPQTKIEFSLSKNTHVTMTLYDILGREVLEIYNNKYFSTGTYELTLDLGKTNLSSGIYFYRFSVFDSKGGNIFTESKKLIYLK